MNSDQISDCRVRVPSGKKEVGILKTVDKKAHFFIHKPAASFIGQVMVIKRSNIEKGMHTTIFLNALDSAGAQGHMLRIHNCRKGNI